MLCMLRLLIDLSRTGTQDRRADDSSTISQSAGQLQQDSFMNTGSSKEYWYAISMPTGNVRKHKHGVLTRASGNHRKQNHLGA